MNWLQQVVNQHRELESPRSFWYWSAIASISAVVKDQVWLDRQIFNLYPNIYVMLHAESGMKKGPPISMANQLVKAVNNTRIYRGRSSIQGILKDLGTAFTQPGGKVISKAVAFICSSELTSSLVDDKVVTKLLTDLYDRQYNAGEWKSLLKMENFDLKDPTITMLTATNEAMGEDFFTRAAIQGGYFARTFIVYEKDNQTDNSLIYPLETKIDYPGLASYLKEIAELKGPFCPLAADVKNDEYHVKRIIRGREVWFSPVGAMYDDWYNNFRQMVREQETKDETGTLNRFGDSVLKVAMLLSLAQHPKLTITMEAMEEAIVECEKLLGNVRRTTLGKQGMSNAALLKSLVIMELLNREPHTVTRVVLMKKMWMHYESSEEFDNMMQAFDASGMITTSSVGNNILYTMPEGQVAELKKFMAGKGK